MHMLGMVIIKRSQGSSQESRFLLSPSRLGTDLRSSAFSAASTFTHGAMTTAQMYEMIF